MKIVIATRGTVDLAEGIIDDTCLVKLLVYYFKIITRFNILSD